MDPLLLVIIALVAVAVFLGGALYLGLPLRRSGTDTAQGSMRAIVSAQRYGGIGGGQGSKASLSEIAEKTTPLKVKSSHLNLKKLLKYAQWKMPPPTFRAAEIGLGLVGFLICRLFFGPVLQAVGGLLGVVIMQWALLTAVDKRFKAFEKDYAPFLMSLVGLLKTGMNPVKALQAAAEGLEDGSLVKSEVELMLERLRIGVSEEQSIGAFGEDVFHPEIELFVQALILSKRVGGNLSDTLERLAQQVRKRQYFRQSAQAAVSMQRGSIWIIIVILLGIELYVYWLAPELILTGLRDPIGWMIWQGGICMILFGMYMIRQITKIKI